MRSFYIVSCALFGFFDAINAIRMPGTRANARGAVMGIDSETNLEGTKNGTSSWDIEMQKLRDLTLHRVERVVRPRTPRRRLAVLIAGLQDRVLLASKIKHVIYKVAAQGYTTDVYISLVRSGTTGNNHTYEFQPGTVNSDEKSNGHAIRNAMRGVGQLTYFSVLPHQLDIHVPRHHPRRMWSYFDCKERDCPKPWGYNVLRRYKALEMLFNQTIVNGVDYDFILVTADDDEWLGPLNIAEFELMRHSSNTLFTKDCKTFGGINDKTQLYGAEAARKVLSAVYTDFFADSDSKLTTSNTERYLKRFTHKRGVALRGMPYGSLPTASSVYIQYGRDGKSRRLLCQKPFYLCDGLPNSTEFQRPTPCPL